MHRRTAVWFGVVALFTSFAVSTGSAQEAEAATGLADIVFVIDESQSMQPYQQAVIDNVDFIAQELAASGLDARLGLLGYGQLASNQFCLDSRGRQVFGHDGGTGRPHIHTPLTDTPGFQTALDELIDCGQYEPGFGAVYDALGDAMGFREGSGVCVVLISDEDADDWFITKADALAALQGRDATFYGIIRPGTDEVVNDSSNDYGPNPGSLAAETDGAVFNILGFGPASGQDVLDELLQNCIGSILGEGNLPPTADAGGPYTGDEASPISLDGSGSSDPDGDPLTYSWSVDSGNCTFDDDMSATPTLTCSVPGNVTVTLMVDDGNGGSDSTTASVMVQSTNAPPVADAGGPYTGDEGTSISLDGSSSYDPDGDPLTYSWSVDSGVCSFDDDSSVMPTLGCADNGNFVVTLTVDDGNGGSDTTTAGVTINNVSPVLGPIMIDPTLIPVGGSIDASAAFTDQGEGDTHDASWDWGNGTTDGTVTQGAGSGSVADSRTYNDAGVYPVTLTVTDDDGGSASATYEYVVVYDPDGGFVTGGGWIYSEAGNYLPDPTLEGKATFGFVSKYKKGASVPTGNTEFQFQTADLNFHSSSYEWLVVTGSDYGRFKGVGTINRSGEYKFMIWAGDGDPDTFRIKIWTEDSGGETVYYDNGMNQPLGAGSIVVHKG